MFDICTHNARTHAHSACSFKHAAQKCTYWHNLENIQNVTFWYSTAANKLSNVQILFIVDKNICIWWGCSHNRKIGEASGYYYARIFKINGYCLICLMNYAKEYYGKCFIESRTFMKQNRRSSMNIQIFQEWHFYNIRQCFKIIQTVNSDYIVVDDIYIFFIICILYHFYIYYNSTIF